MPDASGTPTTNYSIPKYNTGTDPPSGKGFNTAIDFIDALLANNATLLGARARLAVRKNSGGADFIRRRINFIEGSGVTLVVADDAGNEEVDVTIAAASNTSTVYTKTTAKDVANTTVETDLLNGEITLGANTLGANGWADIFLSGDMLYNPGADYTLRIRVKLGGTTIWDSGAQSVLNFGTPNRSGWSMQMRLSNIAATNAQQLLGTIVTSGSPVAVVTGWGTFDENRVFAGAFGGSAAEDTTAAKALVVTAQWGTAHASASMRLQGAHIVVNNKA